MKFKHGTRRRALQYEKDWVERWKDNKTFEKSIENRPADKAYVFYDGPPFITGVPHHGTLLSSIVKDAVPRYQTMLGYRVRRVWGWDTHGLPAEVFTEKKLGIKDRRDIGTKISLEKYITTARENMVQTGNLWNDTIDRIGRWVDMEHAYRTMDPEYMESIWWGFKTLYDKAKIYEGERVLMYCTRDATPLSKAEVTMDSGAYQEVTDPSVYVRFKLQDDTKKPKNIKLNDKSKILFVCYGNITRSQIAKAVYNLLTNSQNADSAGVAVKDVVPNADTYARYEELEKERKGLDTFIGRARYILKDRHNIDIAESSRQQLTPQMLKDYDLVVNIAEQRQTPDWLRGENVVWWDVFDPHGKSNTEAIRVYNEIYALVSDLVAGEVHDDGIDSKFLLAWTTTPWTLPANTAVAVNKDFVYAEVNLGGEHLILAKDLLDKVLTNEKHQPLDYEVVRTFKGTELVGKSYEPLFGVNRGENAHKVWHAPYVSDENGTGIVHLAPAYGEEDFDLAKVEGIPVVHVIDENGLYSETEWKGENVWEINKTIAKALYERGTVWKIEYIRHSYPHCHRCGTRLMYRAHPSWFFDVQGQKDLMLEKADEQIYWFPEHLKHGRWQKNIEQAPDWNLSRDRFWATAMPVWEGVDKDGNSRDKSGKKYQIVVGSYDELEALSGKRLDDYHRPWVDEIEFDKDGVHYKRIDKVLDGWFESGSMPYAQFHYPFENKEVFEKNFPGDFIAEYIGQIRAWFYYLHVVSVGLFGESSFKNVITTGVMAGNDGRKMSKSYGNYTDPNVLMDKFSADSLRFLLLASPLLKGEDFSLQDKEVGDTARKLSMIWNMYDFFTMYAEVDDFTFPYKTIKDSAFHESSSSFEVNVDIDKLDNPLDRWIVSRLHEVNRIVTEKMDVYDIPSALEPILPFIDDASNWYVRRSRRRFWKSEDDSDKTDAYRTLHYILLKLAVVLAPFTPFLSEELYHNLGGSAESVHLLDWPTDYTVDQKVLDDMAKVREYVNEGLSIRSRLSLKVRQPLASITVPSLGNSFDFEPILTEELNVKTVLVGDTVELDQNITPELKREGLMREVVRLVQAARKKAGLNVEDRIKLALVTKNQELQQSIDEYSLDIKRETLAQTITDDSSYTYSEQAEVEGNTLRISLEKS